MRQFGKDRSDREYVETSWRQQSTALAILSELGVADQCQRLSRHADGDRRHRPFDYSAGYV